MNGEHPIRTWRINQRLTLAELAAKVGCKAPHLSEIETYGKLPSVVLARRIAAATDLPLAQVLSESPNKEAAE